MVQKQLYDIALGVGIRLSNVQLDKFKIYHHILSDWNNRINLTSIKGEEEIYSKHFWDSLNICRAMPLDFFNRKRLLDVGTGGGFPGLPLGIVFPQNKITLVEARADTFREKFDVVLSRALGSLPIGLELTLPFCRIGGITIFYKGKSVTNEVTKLCKTIDLLGGSMNQLVELDRNDSLPRRIFVIIDKYKQTPEKFPRRSGIPQKRPLIDKYLYDIK